MEKCPKCGATGCYSAPIGAGEKAFNIIGTLGLAVLSAFGPGGVQKASKYLAGTFAGHWEDKKSNWFYQCPKCGHTFF